MTKQDELTAGLQAELARVNARLAVQDAIVGGTGVLLDGKRIDPASIYAEQPAPPPECKTEAEKTAFAFGWWKALETQREQRPIKTYHGGKPWPVAPSDLNPEHIIRQLVTALEGSGTRLRTDQWYVEIEAVAAGKRYLAEMALLGREKMDEEHRVGFDGPDED